ncbi:hypothetical protein Psi02_66910 [Planotetraspora silvatica]|uniref:Uncharacterized protein n=1 Tax=Planotetraspora silvatica TaxID=234614 RepID=A0A8J3US24_9ACTN|nr:hypothetical protein Psi02_66910 [Planotetraspora silvatica]
MLRLSPLVLVSCALLTACSPSTASGPADRASHSASRPSASTATSSPSPEAAAEPDLVTLLTGPPAATKSPLYAAPRAKADCRLPAITPGSRPAMQKYMASVSTCLDDLWSREFKATRIAYTPPERKFIQRQMNDPECGAVPPRGADGYYCGATNSPRSGTRTL